jgi:hypothetical protein
MTALAALVLLASSTVRAEELLTPGALICTCVPAVTTASAPPVAAVEAPAPSWNPGRLGLYAGATSLALFGGSFAAHMRSSDPTLQGGDNRWNTASTALLIGGAAMAGFTAALFAFRF